jgi:hypothetical protein
VAFYQIATVLSVCIHCFTMSLLVSTCLPSSSCTLSAPVPTPTLTSWLPCVQEQMKDPVIIEELRAGVENRYAIR